MHARASGWAIAVACAALGCAPPEPRGQASGGTLASASGGDPQEGTTDAMASSSGADGPVGSAGGDSSGADASSTAASTSESSGGDGTPGHGDPAGDVPEHLALLDEIEGWGMGTTGGIAGTIFVVDTLADDGPTSLRAALERSDALWIVFAPGLDGVVELAGTIQVGSDKTVDARGHAIQIRTQADDTGMKIVQQSNVILVNLVFDDEVASWDQDSEGEDGITIHDSSYIWVHHCSFARWLDGAIDIRFDGGELSHHISVTWSRFEQDYQALNWTADRISFGHNVCDQVRRRCIQVIDGKGHSYNNVIGDWNADTIQTAKDGAQLWSQRNIFLPAGASTVNNRVNGGKIRNTNHHTMGNVTFAGGNDALDQGFMDESELLANIVSCGDGDDACWQELRATIEDQAGAQ